MCSVRTPQAAVIVASTLHPRSRKEMRLHQQPGQIRVPDRLAHPRVEARRRPEDHIVVLEQDPGDEPWPGLIPDVSPLEE